MRQLLHLLAGCALLAIVSGCGSHEASPPVAACSGGQQSAGFRCYSGAYLSFARPRSWKPRHYEVVSSFSTVLVYLSNQLLHDPCRRSSSAITCASPLQRLRRGGVLVEWDEGGMPGWTLGRPDGTIGGLSARVQFSRPSAACRHIGGTRTVRAVTARRLPHTFYSLDACLRGPHVRAAEHQLRLLLQSTRFVQD